MNFPIKKLIIACLAFTIGMISILYLVSPVYPDFEKEVASVEALSQALEKSSDIFLPQTGQLQQEDGFYSVLLADSTRFAKPSGYAMLVTFDHEGQPVDYDLICDMLMEEEPIRPDILYRDIPMEFAVTKETSAQPECVSSLYFVLEGHLYGFYGTHSLPQGEDAAIDQQIEANLTAFAQQVIDRALA